MVEVTRESCQRWLYNGSECSLCVDSCPVEGCLRFSGSAPSADRDSCIECGVCTTACPTGALSLKGLTDGVLWQRLEAATTGKKKVFIGCHLATIPEPDSTNKAVPTLPAPGPSIIKDRAIDETAFVRLPCIAVLTESHLVALIAGGAEEIFLETSGCARCSLTTAKTIIERSVSYASILTKNLGLSMRLKLVGTETGETANVSWQEIRPGKEYTRRELLSVFDLSGLHGDFVESTGPESTDTDAPLPERRSVLLDAICRLDRDGAEVEAGSVPLRELTVGEECTFCGKCDVFCPTGALRSNYGEDTATVEFRRSRCMACAECREHCNEGAIRYKETIDLRALTEEKTTTLLTRRLQQCAECAGSYLSKDGTTQCPRCAKKSAVDERVMATLFG